jgi:nicotinamidase-related amidase
MLMDVTRSCLLVIDVQERLLPAIHRGAEVVENIAWLMDIARQLEVPTVVSEQYPRGLGHTVEELARRTSPEMTVEKIHFSCAASEPCLAALEATGREQFVLAGIEAHVCVLQTALGLFALGKEVYVVAEAVSSRREADASLGLSRMGGEGVRLVGREMVAFEWLHQAGTETFRTISKKYLR